MGPGLVVGEEEDEDEDKEERGRNETDCVGVDVDDKPDKDCPIVECGKVVVSMVEE